jgi:macrolide-specific efflux system membrane fusion protein
MKKIIVLVIIVLAAFGGYKYYSNKKKSRVVHYVPVTVARSEIKDIVTTSGDVEPLNRVVVKPAVSGRVEKLLVVEGDKVKRGQVLAYLSSTDRVAILDAASTKGPEEYAKWEDTYKPTPVISPLDGTVILVAVVQGQTLDTSTSMFALSDDLIVKASVDESDIGRIKNGQHAVITLDAYPDKPIVGTVFQTLYEGVTVSNVVTYYVKIRPNVMPGYFKSQMSATIKVTVSDRKDVVSLPDSAITEQNDGTRGVYVGQPPNLQFVPLKIGVDDGVNAEVLAGVSDGDTIYYKAKDYKPQSAVSSSSPFMPSGPKRTQTGSGSSHTSGGGGGPRP